MRIELGRRRVLLDAALAQQDDLVGHAHGLGLVVRDVDHGDAELLLQARISRRISWRSWASRLDSGSSIRHTGASAISARPRATRCC